jgi:hypothetical protein
MNKIGFKCSWIQEESKNVVKTAAQVTYDSPAVEHLHDVQKRLQELEKFICSTAFSKLSKNSRSETLNTLIFLVKTSLMINIPTVEQGLTEYGAISLDSE